MLRHRHMWHASGHADGCHSFQTYYACRCGAERVVSQERSIEIDPYSVIWMLDQDCARCKELLDGAQPHVRSQAIA
jgi:hypothetical protein